MSKMLSAMAQSKIAIALFAVLLLCSGAALASCSSGGGLRGTIASLDLANTSFVLTPQQNSAGVTSVTVTVNPQTEFRGALHSFSDLKTGMQVSVAGTPQTSTGTLSATEVEDQHDAADDAQQTPQGDQQGDGQDASEFQGTVNSLDTAHTSFELKLADATVKTVSVSAQTEFEGTLHAFAGLTQGERVSVKGTVQADGSIAAASVEAEDENEQDDADETELKGTVSATNTAHSAFALKLADGTTHIITVNAQTEFDGGLHGLSDLKNGMSVEVRGAAQSNGDVLATRVHGEDDASGSSGDDGHGGHGGDGGDDGSGHD